MLLCMSPLYSQCMCVSMWVKLYPCLIKMTLTIWSHGTWHLLTYSHHTQGSTYVWKDKHAHSLPFCRCPWSYVTIIQSRRDVPHSRAERFATAGESRKRCRVCQRSLEIRFVLLLYQKTDLEQRHLVQMNEPVSLNNSFPMEGVWGGLGWSTLTLFHLFSILGIEMWNV